MEAILMTRQQATATPASQLSPKRRRPAARVADGKSRRGFASMDPALQQRFASEGGKASAISGRGHKWTTEQAREAGRKGGLISRRRKAGNNEPNK